MAGITNKQILDAIDSMRQEELADIRSQLKAMNGRVRMTEQAVASFQTWRYDHGKGVHDALDTEVRSLRSRASIAGIVLAIGQAATTAWAVIVGTK